jgi:nucleotide-binding universal stress UspA family protein
VLFTRLLVPIDFSEASIEALRLAVAIAMRVGARVTVLHVDTDALPSPSAQPAMHRLLAIEVPSSLMVDMEFDEGSAADRINHHAKAGQHDLVVMGTNGKTGLERVVLGSVAETVVRTCSVPVLVTHNRDQPEASS